MRVIYKGYAATTYGKSSLSVTDPEGREVMHSENVPVYDEKMLKEFLREYVKSGEEGVSNEGQTKSN